MMRIKIIHLLLILLFFHFNPVHSESEHLHPAEIKRLIHENDQIVAGVLKSFTKEQLGAKTVFYGVLLVEEILSSSLKKNQEVEVFWEQDPITHTNHENYVDIKAIWFLSTAGGIYDVNSNDRIQNLNNFELVYRELNKRTTRAYIPNKLNWLGDDIPAVLIIRNIEDKNLTLPLVALEGKNLVIDKRVNLNLFPITSFSKDKTTIGKKSMEKLPSLVVKDGATKELKRDEEIRIEINLANYFKVDDAKHYSLEFNMEGFPGQRISGFQVRKRPKLMDDLDFLKIANDRFAEPGKLKTVRVLMETIGEQDPVIAWSILQKISNLSISGKELTDLSPLAGLHNLVYLDLSNNKITDLVPLRNLKQLRFLDLSKNNIEDINTLRGLSSLEYLDLSYNAIEDVAPINQLTTLVNLQISNNLLTNFKFSNGLITLKELNVSSNMLEDVKSISKMIALSKVNLKANRIQNIDPLAFNYNMELLDVRENPVAYIDSLSDLEKPHKNIYGRMIKLLILHDLFKKSTEPKKEEGEAESVELLPEIGQEIKQPEPQKKKETMASFKDVVEESTGLTIKDIEFGTILSILEKEGFVIAEYKKTDEIKKNDKLTVFRGNDYVGIVKVIDIQPQKVVGQIMAELNNSKGLKIQKGDQVKISSE